MSAKNQNYFYIFRQNKQSSYVKFVRSYKIHKTQNYFAF